MQANLIWPNASRLLANGSHAAHNARAMIYATRAQLHCDCVSIRCTPKLNKISFKSF